MPRSHSCERLWPRIALALLTATIPVQAGFLKIWQLNETETAPVLVTGQVLAIHKGARAAKQSAAWTHDAFEMAADIRTQRSYTRSGQPLPAGQIQVSFFEYSPPLQQMVCCTPPPLAHLEVGETALLPLKENADPTKPWNLMADEGVNATLPARVDLPEAKSPPATARAFILREIANLLAQGTPGEAFRASEYLASQHSPVPELIPILEAQVEQRDRWAEIATSVVAAGGTPRPTLADLFQPRAQSLPIARAALGHLMPSEGTDALLIRTLVAEAPVHAWGSANSLLEFFVLMTVWGGLTPGIAITPMTVAERLVPLFAVNAVVVALFHWRYQKSYRTRLAARDGALAERRGIYPTASAGAPRPTMAEARGHD